MRKINQDLYDLPFDQFSRQAIVAELIDEVIRPRFGKKPIKIMDVGGHMGKTKQFQPDDDVTILDVFDKKYDGYIQGSGTDLQFKDNSFDVIVSFDVLEHIKKEDREKFIKECARVAKVGVFLCFPYNTATNSSTETALNILYRAINNKDHPWLLEHIENGLPDARKVEELFNEYNMYTYRKFSNPLNTWIQIQSAFFLSTILNTPSIASGDMNRHYNENYKAIEKEASADNSYRVICFASSDKKLVNTMASYDVRGVDAKEMGSTTNFIPNVLSEIFTELQKTYQLDLHDRDSYIEDLEHNIENLEKSKSWRMTRPLRYVNERTRYISLKGRHSIVRRTKPAIIKVLFVKVGGRHLFLNKYTRCIPGFSYVVKKVDSRMLVLHTANSRQVEYKKWFSKKSLSKWELTKQHKEQASFKVRPLVSVLVPTYDTNIEYLRECIESVISQTYNNWELCLSDDASTDVRVRDVIMEYAKKDSRIKYVFRKKNGHICIATNSALKLATGNFIALLDHDDILGPNALYEVVSTINKNPKADFIYSDEDKIEGKDNDHVDPFFKPDWSPEFLRSINYITHFAVIRRKLVEDVGGFRTGYEGAQDWDLFLRVSRKTDNVVHVPKVIYSWRKSETSTAQQSSAKEYAYTSQKAALLDDIRARGLRADVSWQIPYSMWKIAYKIKDDPKVSIIIPTKDQYTFIDQCLRSIDSKTTYKNIEVVVVDTGSSDERVWDLYEEYQKKWPHMKLLKWKKKFNFAAVCNFGAENSKGDYYLFLNNDTEIITPSWVEDMLGYAEQKDVGAVGCKLLYPDNRLQHGGIILGVGGQNDTPGIAGHYFPAFIDNPPQDPAQLMYVGGTRNFTAVTAACVMVEKDKFNKVDGFDKDFRIAFNDVDFCLKLYDSGLRNVYLPHVQLYHHESVSVGKPGSKVRDVSEFQREIDMMIKRWQPLIENDPYYHPEFRRDVASARLKY